MTIRTTLVVFLVIGLSDFCCSQCEYIYEMYTQEVETGYYYITYSNDIEDSSSYLTVKVTDFFDNRFCSPIMIIMQGDTLNTETNNEGLLTIQVNETGTPLCIYINKNGTKYSVFYDCIYFWQSKGKDILHPKELTIILGVRNNATTHIKSDKPLSSDDIRSIKLKSVEREYSHEIPNHVYYRKITYQ